jgi:hypothetical protein
MMRKTVFIVVSICTVLAMLISGCAQFPGNWSQQIQNAGKTGTLEVRVTDAPPEEEIIGVKVTVESVEINQSNDETVEQEQETETEQAQGSQSSNSNKNKNKNKQTTTTSSITTLANTTSNANGWQKMYLVGEKTFDLLQIQGLEQIFATLNIPAGTYHQISLDVSKVQVTFKGGRTEDAKLPSGKLKFINSFEIVTGQTTVILFDFDAAQSIHEAGNGKVMFQPVIKLSTTRTPGKTEITTPSIPDGVEGIAYEETTLKAIGGTAPYTWNLDNSTLPANLVLSPAGVIFGTPAAGTSGNYTVTVKVADNSAPTKKNADTEFTFNIAPQGSLQITTNSLTNGTVNLDYEAQVKAVGASPLTWSQTDLPAGLNINAATGVISGKPVAKGNYTFTINVTGEAKSDSKSFTINVASEKVRIVTDSLPDGIKGIAFSTNLAAEYGTGSYSWSIIDGFLQSDLVLNLTTGAISGTPTASGVFTFKVKVTDQSSGNNSDTKTFTIGIADKALKIDTTSLPAGTAGAAYALVTLAGSGGLGDYTWTLDAGSFLPAGLSLSTAGVISGTPAAAGTANFVIKVNDSASPANVATKALSIVIS